MLFSDCTCDRCQAEVHYAIRPRYYPLADDSECMLHASHVWCNGCNTLRSAETFPAAEALKEKRDEL